MPYYSMGDSSIFFLTGPSIYMGSACYGSIPYTCFMGVSRTYTCNGLLSYTCKGLWLRLWILSRSRAIDGQFGESQPCYYVRLARHALYGPFEVYHI